MVNTQNLIDMYFMDNRYPEEYERNDEALLKLVDYARSHPDNWDQDEWVTVDWDGVSNLPDVQDELDVIVTDDSEPVCGTTMCLAGFQVHVFDRLSPRDKNEHDILYPQWAGWRLGLNQAEARRLFTASNSEVDAAVNDIISNKYRGRE